MTSKQLWISQLLVAGRLTTENTCRSSSKGFLRSTHGSHGATPANLLNVAGAGGLRTGAAAPSLRHLIPAPMVGLPLIRCCGQPSWRRASLGNGFCRSKTPRPPGRTRCPWGSDSYLPPSGKSRGQPRAWQQGPSPPTPRGSQSPETLHPMKGRKANGAQTLPAQRPPLSLPCTLGRRTLPASPQAGWAPGPAAPSHAPGQGCTSPRGACPHRPSWGWGCGGRVQPRCRWRCHTSARRPTAQGRNSTGPWFWNPSPPSLLFPHQFSMFLAIFSCSEYQSCAECGSSWGWTEMSGQALGGVVVGRRPGIAPSSSWAGWTETLTVGKILRLHCPLSTRV